MNRLHVLPATVADAERLAPRLRDADRAEVLAASGKSAEEALVLGVATSADAYTVHSPLGPMAIFGVVDHGWGLGAPWLLGSDDVRSHYFEFARRSRDEFERIRRPYSRLTNYIDDRNELHKRWLSWLGFEFSELEPRYGVAKIPFWRFDYFV